MCSCVCVFQAETFRRRAQENENEIDMLFSSGNMRIVRSLVGYLMEIFWHEINDLIERWE